MANPAQERQRHHDVSLDNGPVSRLHFQAHPPGFARSTNRL